jgi:hypothetical protein
VARSGKPGAIRRGVCQGWQLKGLRLAPAFGLISGPFGDPKKRTWFAALNNFVERSKSDSNQEVRNDGAHDRIRCDIVPSEQFA